MNERIEQLAEQADIDWTNWKVDEDGTLPRSCLEKFAVLIIRECADVALREDHEPSDCILTHFGLKR